MFAVLASAAVHAACRAVPQPVFVHTHDDLFDVNDIITSNQSGQTSLLSVIESPLQACV